MWAPTDPTWNEQVRILEHRRLGPRDLRNFLREAGRARVLILRGSVSFGERYRDLVFALAAKALRNRPGVVITDATWEQGSAALERRLPRFLRPLVPKLARLAVRLVDSPRVHYCVLSTDEAGTFPAAWGVDPDRVHFTAFPHTLYDGAIDTATRDGDYVFAGGNSLRDYDLLEAAVGGTGIEVHIAATWRGSGAPNLVTRVLSHQEFVDDLAGCGVCVVPLQRTIRSAGQQTYLNAMALGKLVVVTDGPGVRDYIEDGVTGVICAPDPESLAAAIAGALDPGQHERNLRIAEQGRQSARTSFTEYTYRRELLRIAEGAARAPQS
jgi:glycosyltransferase involved in cell wall biosynthesis